MFEKSRAPFDTLLPLVLLGLLALGCLVVLLPFLTAVLWACILAYSTWPAYLHLHRSFGSRSWAAGVMTLTVATVIILPAVLVGSELVENSAPVIASIQSFLNDGLPSPPGWISSIPLVGPTLANYIAEHANNASAVSAQLREFVRPAQGLILDAARTIAAGLVELVLSVLIAFFFYRDGAFIARWSGSAEKGHCSCLSSQARPSRGSSTECWGRRWLRARWRWWASSSFRYRVRYSWAS